MPQPLFIGQGIGQEIATVRTAVRQTGDSFAAAFRAPDAFIAREPATAAVHFDGNAPRTP
jgi:hypothetical protein